MTGKGRKLNKNSDKEPVTTEPDNTAIDEVNKTNMAVKIIKDTVATGQEGVQITVGAGDDRFDELNDNQNRGKQSSSEACTSSDSSSSSSDSETSSEDGARYQHKVAQES